MKWPVFEQHRVLSVDGQGISYGIRGNAQGPAIMLCNGLGGGSMVWAHQVRLLEGNYRFIAWDYRGLYGSSPLLPEVSVGVDRHVDDALCVLDAQGVDRVTLFCWSSGVQLGLEIFRRLPDRVRAMVLVNGLSGRLWGGGHRAWSSTMSIRGFQWAQRMSTVVESATRMGLGWPETLPWLRRVGFVGNTVDESLWLRVAGSFRDLDMGQYFALAEAFGRHDAADVLSQVDVPVLVISGDRDPLAPRHLMEAMARSLPNDDFLLVPGGTHFVLMEFAELVGLRMEKFLLERGYGPSPSESLPGKVHRSAESSRGPEGLPTSGSGG